jgi:hypothetical protein
MKSGRHSRPFLTDNLQYNMKNADTGKGNRENGSMTRMGL